MRPAWRAGWTLAAAAAALGGCEPAGAPPAPPTGLAAAVLQNPAARWDSLTGGGVTTYLQADGFPARRADELHDRSRAAVRHALDLLDEPAYPGHLRVFYVDSRATMRRLIGEGPTGIADPEGRAVLLVEREAWRAFTRHEVMHAVSLEMWGQPGGAPHEPRAEAEVRAWYRGGWLREGIAAAAEDRCGPYDNRGAAARMALEGDRIPLAAMQADFYRQDELAGYLQAGSLVQYLLDTRGVERFRRLWRTGSLDDAYGAEAASIEAEWDAWLRSASRARMPASTEALRERGCG